MQNSIRKFIPVLFLLSAYVGAPAPGRAEGQSPDAQAVFEQYADRVGKIQVIEMKSEAKAAIGTGFFVSAEGHIITNYHVVSRLIHNPDRYRAEFIDGSGKAFAVSLEDVDVVHDLAVIRSDARPAKFFQLAPVHISQGAHLYSLGYPLDIGISIVEGTHNGYLTRSSYRYIHFTGSINPGMSGGPAITSSGKVAGINVATTGNQVSFLVPVEPAIALLDSALAATKPGPRNLLDRVRSQILSHQETAVPDDLMKSGSAVRLGNFELPGQISPSFNCWADPAGSKKHAYEVVTHECSSNEMIYVSDTHRSGIIKFRHRLITTDKLNAFRFYELFTVFFRQHYGLTYGNEDEVTRYSCRTGTMEHNGMIFKTVFCARGYRKLPGLYDVVFKAAVLGSKDSGLETALTLSGVSFEKALRLSRDYLERITWKE